MRCWQERPGLDDDWLFLASSLLTSVRVCVRTGPVQTTEIPFRASAYDPIDALNPGGLGKIVDVSRIFVPEPSVTTVCANDSA